MTYINFVSISNQGFQFQMIDRSGQPPGPTYDSQSFSWQVELPSQLYLKYDGVEYRGDRNDIIVAKYVELNKLCPFTHTDNLRDGKL